MPSIIWVDSDPDIKYSAKYLMQQNYDLKFFNETLDCLEYVESLTSHSDISCIITSMMEGGGRKEKGKMNAFEMVNRIRMVWKHSYSPFLVMITLSADEQACKDNGFDRIIYDDRLKMQKIVVDSLNKKTNLYYKKIGRDPELKSCFNFRENAKKFLETLKLNPKDFDPFADRCFCVNCEPNPIWYRGKPSEKYILPTNWYRYGLKIRDEYLSNQIETFDWHVAYHGTKVRNLRSILTHRRIMFPGDRLNDGTILKIAHNNCFQKHFRGPVIYVSPSIKYASHDVYAEPVIFDEMLAKVVIQCRIRPNSYRKFQETLEFKDTVIDKNIPNSEIEWVTDDRTAVVPYGLLIGFDIKI